MTTSSNIQFTASSQHANDRAIGVWLMVCAGMVLAMIVIGGITRLTESGLSIVYWRPVTGFLPPLTDADWAQAFDLYRATPQYLEVNAGMTLAEFRAIFWWEYIHRLWGRLIGLVFFLPFVWFLIRGRVRMTLVPRLVLLFLLGGAQGALGWYMVRSGLVDIPAVSQYRLAAHLSLAFVIYAALVWTGLSLIFPNPAAIADRLAVPIRRLALLALGLISLTILSGAFVAGTDAGLIFNSFPLMDGSILPPGYFDHAAAPFEDHGTIQFHHRVLALASLAAVTALWWRSRWLALAPRARRVDNGLMAMAVAQVLLGITTLLLVVPVHLAATHQAGAVLLFTTILWFTHELRGRP
ncbi:MAG: COX15/CtaA family protein [Proteobacteria bacterium]|nr:COX15/CtaA family protein [Pseudomonadota bacterium]